MTPQLPWLIRSGAAVLIGCGLAVAAQPALDAENLIVSPPGDFKVGYDSHDANKSITEFVPAQETVEDWTRMLTVQVFRHAKIEAAAFLQGVGKGFAEACPGTTVRGNGIRTGQVNGYVVSMLFLQCPKNPATGKPETTIFRAIKGNDALYLVQRAWRAVPAQQDVDETMQALAHVMVCDTRASEHPCPAEQPLR
jgi:hypothetical protein